MKIFNSLTRQKEDFVPQQEGEVSMYVCGPTVYDFIHIGNARPLVVFDTVRKYLEYKNYKVNYIQNFTDVDDKIINRAVKENTSAEEIAQKFIQEAITDMEGLGVKEPSKAPKVTEEMEEIIEMIEMLISKDHAYEKSGSVYFRTSSFEKYGELSGRKLEELESGARVEVNEEKENPGDFVLWKARKNEQSFWESPWGEGRPGWHIECSAMAKKYIGDTIDIHGGGLDLTFPHHENEIAQSECANNAPFAKYFMHNGFINIDDEKMSKSKGNFFTVRDISKEFDYKVIRFFILSVHYRSPVNFSHEQLEGAKSALSRIETCLNNLNFLIEKASEFELQENEQNIMEKLSGFKTQFETAMEDDFNTADAISVIFELVRFANVNVTDSSSKKMVQFVYDDIYAMCNLLGIASVDKTIELNSEIEKLIAQRQQARAEKDFFAADRIRDALLAKGIVLEDTRGGVRWHKVR